LSVVVVVDDDDDDDDDTTILYYRAYSTARRPIMKYAWAKREMKHNKQIDATCLI
jgi:hypothetical protein